MASLDTLCTAFEGSACIASGPLREVALRAKIVLDAGAENAAPLPVLVFDDATSETIELDWRGSVEEFVVRLVQQAQSAEPEAHSEAADQPVPVLAMADAPRGPGRPRLGVVAREITLLPRHWEWLATQQGGASVALRKLVEVARRDSEQKDLARTCTAAGYKFMATMAGHEPGFEEATRSLFAGDRPGFEAQVAHWPADVQAHLQKILANAFLA